jgi:hypothetical protein
MNSNKKEKYRKITSREMKKILELSDTQRYINSLAKKYKNKKILGYGTGLTTETVFNNYDLSKLNIVAFSDKKYQRETTYKSFKAIPPDQIKDLNPDMILIFAFHDGLIKESLLQKQTKIDKVPMISIFNTGFINKIKLFLCGYQI